MRRFFFNIDVLGSCNLRCPSCPVGNTKDYKLPAGFMDAQLLAEIVKKAKSECEVTGIGLFNWTEPILHPKLPELIRIVQSNGISSYLSSNLNTMRNIDAVMAENPYSFRISASGFTPEVYGYSHRGGKIDRVKKNMVELAAAKARQKATTRIHVLYHRYKHNLKDEPLMRQFAQSLGIGFQPVWAYMMPLEKTLAYVEDTPMEGNLTDEDHELIANLALPLKEAFEEAVRQEEKACSLQDGQITLDFKGDIQLCCAVYDARKFTLGNYLTCPLDEIQKRKYAHSMCDRCIRHGGNVYVGCYAPKFDNIAARNIGTENARLLDLKYERMQKRVRRGLEWIYQNVFANYLSPEQSAMLGDRYERLQSGLRQIGKALFKA